MIKTKLEHKKYVFQGSVWKHKGPASWYFVTLPLKLAKTIRKTHGSSEEGWGRLKIKAKINSSEWMTAIWYDTKAGSYILPVKAQIRKTESINKGTSIKVTLTISEEKRAF